MRSEADPVLELELEVRGGSEHRPRLELSLRLPAGVTVLFGPSGSGKSTCLSALAGLVRPDRGRIVLGGRTLFDRERGIDLAPRHRRVALVFQSLALFPHLDALANVAFGIPRGLGRGERRSVAQRWLERMRVGHLASRHPGTLSGGEAQRVALARALASTPSLLLLDEPFSALDAGLRRELWVEVGGVVEELGIPALLVTHDREDAGALATRIIHLRDGRVDSNPANPARPASARSAAAARDHVRSSSSPQPGGTLPLGTFE